MMNARSIYSYIHTLEAALRPFANYVDGAYSGNRGLPDTVVIAEPQLSSANDVMSEDVVITKGSSMARRQLTMGDCRAAKKALEFGQ